MLKSDWCAAVLTRARLCLLTIVRTDSIATTRSVATPAFQHSPWSKTSSSLKPISGTPRGTSTRRPRPRTVSEETRCCRQRRRNVRPQKNAVRNSSWWGGGILSHTAISSSRETNRASNGFASFRRARASGLRNILILQQRALTSNSTGLLQVFLEDSELV